MSDKKLEGDRRFETELLIANLQEQIEKAEILESIEALNKKIELILSAIVLQQKEGSELVGVHSDTIKNRFNKGDLDVLQRPGSRFNFVTLQGLLGLQIKRRRIS